MAVLQGRFVEMTSGQGIPGVMVSLGQYRGISDNNGYFSITAPRGNYQLNAIHREFSSYTASIPLSEGTFSIGAIYLRQTRVRAL
jgi:hypothetical protein